MQYLLSEIARISNSAFYGVDSLCKSICYDSRTLYHSENTLFIALKGTPIDGHNFIEDCYKKGVRAFIVSKEFNSFDKYPLAGFIVTLNPLDCLQKLAAFHRSCSSATVVAITGSNGKSSVKEIAAQLYSGCGEMFRSPKSFNSQLGVALSLLMSSGDESLIIIEAGISKRGEMARLADMIRPDIVVITNIGESHSENFRDNNEKLEEKLILAESNNCKKIIYKKLSWESKIIENKFNNDRLHPWSKNDYKISSPFDDKISTENIFVALALLSTLNCFPDDINTRISSLQRISMRMELLKGRENSIIINDSYNSDLGSLKEALSYMQSISEEGKQKIVILSDILQSGLDRGLLYGKVAELLKQSSIDYFIGIGSDLNTEKSKFEGINSEFYNTVDDALKSQSIKGLKNSLILLKGCRSFALERLLKLLEDKYHNTILEINLDNLLHNLSFYRNKLDKGVRTMAMVKAQAYGCGAFEISQALERAKVDYLAVAYADEGVELREKGIKLPIVVLGSDPFSHRAMIENFLEPEIYSLEVLKDFISECKTMAVTHYPIHIKIDSGMHRVGFSSDNIDTLAHELKNQNSVEVKSIFSHLVASDADEHKDFTLQQIEEFEKISSYLIEMLPNTPIKHICNSAAISRFPNAHYDMVRLGIGLYGYGNNEDSLKGVAHLKSVVVQISDVKKGESIGYNRAQTLDYDAKIATIAIGYADGFRRALSRSNWSVMAEGKLLPTIGNISMDSTMIDISGTNIKVGDYVTIFGEKPTIRDMAAKLSTIEYEILTDISPRVKRTYIKE